MRSNGLRLVNCWQVRVTVHNLLMMLSRKPSDWEQRLQPLTMRARVVKQPVSRAKNANAWKASVAYKTLCFLTTPPPSHGQC